MNDEKVRDRFEQHEAIGAAIVARELRIFANNSPEKIATQKTQAVTLLQNVVKEALEDPGVPVAVIDGWEERARTALSESEAS